MPFCAKCGTKNQDDTNVCTSCGNNLGQARNSSGSSGGSFLDKIKGYINRLMQFFDSGEFFRLSWRALLYDLQVVNFVLYILICIFFIFGIMVDSKSFIALTAVGLLIFFIFYTIGCVLSILAIRNRTSSFNEVTEGFSTGKVTLGNFYDFLKIASVHSIETLVYAWCIFLSFACFGLGICGLFDIVLDFKIGNTLGVGAGILLGLLAPLLMYIHVFITKIIVLFLKVFLEYLPKLFIMPIKALYGLFGIIIDTRQNLWK
jgi:hypothetical protein